MKDLRSIRPVLSDDIVVQPLAPANRDSIGVFASPTRPSVAAGEDEEASLELRSTQEEEASLELRSTHEEEASQELRSTQEPEARAAATSVSPASAQVMAAQAQLERAHQALIDAELERAKAKAQRSVSIEVKVPRNSKGHYVSGRVISYRESGAASSRSQAYRGRQRCSICGLIDDGLTTHGCKCEWFPMCLPLGLAFGDIVSVGEDQACALYFAPKGTIWGTNAKPWSPGPPGRLPQVTLSEDSIICLPGTCDKIRFRDMFAAPAATVTQYYELVDGRARRPPSRYEPDRLAASRRITRERRKECFDQTIAGQHRCFSCFCLLVFTMDEEYRINTDPDTSDADKVRCHEAGHVYPHSKAAVEFSDRDLADALWNLIPLCHNCNCRMGRQQAFQFIDAGNPTMRDVPEYIEQKQQFERNFPNAK